jgi:hypothetical protein
MAPPLLSAPQQHPAHTPSAGQQESAAPADKHTGGSSSSSSNSNSNSSKPVSASATPSPHTFSRPTGVSSTCRQGVEEYEAADAAAAAAASQCLSHTQPAHLQPAHGSQQHLQTGVKDTRWQMQQQQQVCNSATTSPHAFSWTAGVSRSDAHTSKVQELQISRSPS